MKIWLALIFTVSASTAFAGNFVNNGMDDFARADSYAWFVGGDSISACLEISPDFGVDAATAQNTANDAMAIWAKYLAAKKLDVSLSNVGIVLGTQLKFQQTCTGNEDLKFYFGVDNDDVRAAKKSFAHPLAFSSRQSYDKTTRRGKGFIWIASPTQFSKPLSWVGNDHLLGALLHELGHVFGCEHVSDTIMTADLADDILRQDSDFLHLLDRIDRGKQLYICEHCAKTYALHGFNQKALQSLVGTLSDRASGTLTFVGDSDRLPHGTIKIVDGGKTQTLQIEFRSLIANSFSDTLNFNVPGFINGVVIAQGFAARTVGNLYLATITAGSKKLNVGYRENMAIDLSFRTGYTDQIVLLDSDADASVLMRLGPQ